MNEEESKPSVVEQVKNLASLGRVIVSDVLEGKSIFASDELYQERIQVCVKCEYLSPESGGKCKKCGCLLGAKARILGSQCPVNKWIDTQV